MAKKEIIREDMIAALRARDKKRKDNLGYILGMIQNEEIDRRRDLTEDEINVVIFKLIKQTNDVINITPKDRQDILDDNCQMLSMLANYAPVALSEAEIRYEVELVIENMGLTLDVVTGKDKGKIMGTVMKKIHGRANGNFINSIVSEYCK